MKNRPIIGVIASECYGYESSSILQGIIKQAFTAKVNVMVMSTFNKLQFYTEGQWKYDEQIYSMLKSCSFDGFIYFRNLFKNSGQIDRIDKCLLDTQKPVLLVDDKKHKYFETVINHDFSNFELLAEHLIRVHGCKKIYCLTGPKGIPRSEERLQGYKSAMKAHGLFYDKSFYEYGDFWINSPVAFADKILQGKLPKPDAVMCGNDIMASTLINTLEAGGMKVPEDIAVTGFDGEEELSITTIRKNDVQYGAEIMRYLYRLITGERCRKITDIPARLIISKSCGCNEQKSVHPKPHAQQIQNRFEMYMLHSTMMFELMGVKNIEQFFDCVLRHSFLVYCMKRHSFFLTENYMNSLKGENQNMELNLNNMKEVLECRIAETVNDDTNKLTSDIPEYLSGKHKKPVAYYLTPLHFNDSFFGISALSFGKKAMTYNRSYIGFISFIDVGLDRLRMQALVNNISKEAALPNRDLFEKLKNIRCRMKEKCEEKWTIDSICSELNVSRSYLQRMYKEYFGKTIFGELNDFRLKKARKLIEETSGSVSGIAEKCGFSTYSFFLRKFKEAYGVSPSELRNYKKYRTL